MSAAGLVASISGTRMRKKANKALDRELANAPKYKIGDEAFQNQAIARSEAYGRDRGIQGAQENVAQSAADAALEARDVTSSTSALLSTLSAINANKNAQLRGLGQDEASMRNAKLQQLQNVNNQVIDERDKAWNYNENMPFQMRVAKYRDQAKVGAEMEMAGVAAQAQVEGQFAGSLGSMGSMMCDERVKENINPTEYGLKEVLRMNSVEFEYNHPRFDDGKKHVGFIAQEIEEIIPEAIDTIRNDGSENDLKKINYNELVPVLVNAIQEQQKYINQLVKQVKQLQSKDTLIAH